SSSSSRRLIRSDVEAAFRACNDEDAEYMKIGQLKLVMRALGFEPRNAEIEKMTERVKGFSARPSWHGRKGMMDVDELMECIGERNSDKSDEEMKCAFRLFDREDKGWISLENLRTVSRELGEKLGDDDLMEMLKEATGGEGRVTQEHFAAVMKKTCLY
ncbi:hypothetical protein PMAYCL1PPCAC_12452, partial [Pristionchus mayeri]